MTQFFWYFVKIHPAFPFTLIQLSFYSPLIFSVWIGHLYHFFQGYPTASKRSRCPHAQCAWNFWVAWYLWLWLYAFIWLSAGFYYSAEEMEGYRVQSGFSVFHVRGKCCMVSGIVLDNEFQQPSSSYEPKYPFLDPKGGFIHWRRDLRRIRFQASIYRWIYLPDWVCIAMEAIREENWGCGIVRGHIFFISFRWCTWRSARCRIIFCPICGRLIFRRPLLFQGFRYNSLYPCFVWFNTSCNGGDMIYALFKMREKIWYFLLLYKNVLIGLSKWIKLFVI